MFTKGLGLFPNEGAPSAVQHVELAEELGFSNVWLGDSQNLWREVGVLLGATAMRTSRIILGTGVTNVVTRHRSVLASTWATLHELTNGRVALGIGTGDSSLRTMGLKPTKVADLEQAISDLRHLLRGESVTEPTTGAELRLAYLDAPLVVPVYVAASAPRLLELVGRIADGVILLAGTTAPLIDAALAHVQIGARAAGRDLSDLHLVLWTPTAIAADGTTARNLVRSHVARVAVRPLPAPVPATDAEIERIRSSYDYYHHMDIEAVHAKAVSDELVSSYALAGTADTCWSRLQEINGTAIDQVAIVPYVDPGRSRATTMREFAALVEAISESEPR